MVRMIKGTVRNHKKPRGVTRGRGQTGRETEPELHAIRITSSILGYVTSVAGLIEARSMHVVNFNTKDADELMGRQKNKQTNQQNHAINRCFAAEQDGRVTCNQH